MLQQETLTTASTTRVGPGLLVWLSCSSLWWVWLSCSSLLVEGNEGRRARDVCGRGLPYWS